MNIY